jgi:uncharacterized protein (TIGR02001 family)
MQKRCAIHSPEGTCMSFTTRILASALLAAASTVHAQAPAPAAPPPPEHTFTGNFGIYSEYIFRGISQTAGKAAIQGGFDYAHASGFYAGTWGSNISWLEDFGVYSRSSLEWDFYAGFKNTIGDSDFSYDVGTIYYYYPGERLSGVVNADTWEAYAALNWKWLGAKVSYNFDDYFGARPTGEKTDGTLYWDLYANIPLGESGVTIGLHYGILDVSHDASGDFEASYEDWRAGLAYTVPEGLFKGFEVGAYYTGNNAKRGFYTDLTGYDTSKDRGVV